MATYETTFTVPHPVERTFAVVSDFRNAEKWDPRTYAAEKATEGPIGLGTRFVLTGGLLRGELVARFHIPMRLAGMALPYDIVRFDPPHVFVLEGETRLVRYRDEISFSPDGDETRVRYMADVILKGPLSVADRLFQRMFDKIGDDATRDIAATVTRLGDTRT